MFTSTTPNASGKAFDVIDEDHDVLGSFDDIADAAACAKSAPWWSGEVRIRRCCGIVARHHAQELRYRAEAEAAFQAFCYAC